MALLAASMSLDRCTGSPLRGALALAIGLALVAAGCEKSPEPATTPSKGASGNADKHKKSKPDDGDVSEMFGMVFALRDADADFQKGTEAYEAGDVAGAVGAWQRAAKSFQNVEGAERQAGQCYFRIGGALRESRKYAEAIHAYEEALRLLKDVEGTEANQAGCQLNIGMALIRLERDEEAATHLQEALRVYRTVQGAEASQALCHKLMGLALGFTGNHEGALANLQEAVRLYQGIPGTEADQDACRDLMETVRKLKENANKGAGTPRTPPPSGQERGTGKTEPGDPARGPAAAARDGAPGIKEAEARIAQGWVAYRRGDLPGAVAAWSAAETALAGIEGTERQRAACHQNAGVALDNMGKYEASVASHQEALSLYRAIKGTEREQAACYQNIAMALLNLGRYRECLARLVDAEALVATIPGAEADRASCRQNRGVALMRMGACEDGIASVEAALQGYRRLTGTEKEQAECCLNIGAGLYGLGTPEQATAKIEEALRTLRTVAGTERAQAACHQNIGAACNNRGNYEKGIAEGEEALRLFRTIGGAEREQGGCLANIGWAFISNGQYEQGIARLAEALHTYEAIKGTDLEQAQCHYIIGEGKRGAGRPSEALSAYERSLSLSKSWMALSRLAYLYHAKGDPESNEKAFLQSLAAVGLADEARGQTRASAYRASIFEEPSAASSRFVGLVMDMSAEKAGGVRSREELAFDVADHGKNRTLVDALQEKSSLGSARQDAGAAAEDRELSQRISKLTSLRVSLPEAEAERRRKLSEEIDRLQQRRNMIEAERKRTALAGYEAPDWRKPMEMAEDLPTDAAALEYSLGEKEGWLLILTREGITAYKLGVDTPALPELLPRQEATLAQLAEAWQKRPEKVGLDGLVRLARARAEDLGKPEAERQKLIDAAKEQAILERLGAAALPEAAVAELRKKGIHHLLVVPDGSLHYVPLAMLCLKNGKDAGTHYLVEELATSYVPAMTTLDTIRKQKQERAKDRSAERRLLLAFANPDYGTGTVAAISPAAPPQDDMVTRVRAFRTDYYKGGGLRLTSLPETEQEAMRVAALFGPPKTYTKLLAGAPEGQAVVFTGRGASEEEVKQLLAASDTAKACRGWQYVLFSTHGLADTHNGMLSCLALSSPADDSTEDGFLQAQEVMNLELDTDLVMLSACQTGLGRLSGGEGLVGLSAAFFYAGAESVCASLWQVPSGPTSQLVPELFKRLKEGKVDRAEALRQAQLAVLRQGRGPDGRAADYSSPFCWAAFVLIGEYR